MERNLIIQQLAPYFDIKELVCPHCYQKWGVRAWQFLDTNLLWCLLIIRKDILKVPMVVNNASHEQRGLRCNQCSVVKKKNELYLSSHCFDDKTEILTNNGWRTYETIQDSDLVYSYNMNSGVIETKPITKIIKRHTNESLIHIKSVNVDLMVTEGHRMITRIKSKKYVRISEKNLSEKEQAYFDSLKTNNDKWHIELAGEIFQKRRQIKCAGLAEKTSDCDMGIMKLAFATIADGYFQCKGNAHGIVFRFKKTRKCIQLESLLMELGCKVVKHLDKDGVWNYYIKDKYARKVFDIIGKEKHIPLSVLEYGSDALKELVYYYSLYDGCHSKRESDKHFTIVSSIRWNIDMLQTMCALSGMRSQINTISPHEYHINGKTGQGKEAYNITINPFTDESRIDNRHFSVEEYNGNVWCVCNENTTLVTKRNGLISIQGNCLGKAIDAIPNGMTAEQARELIKANADLLPCNIRVEKDVTWLHFDVLPQYGITAKVYEFNG